MQNFIKKLSKLSVLEFGEWSFLTDFGTPVLSLAGTDFYKINKIFGICYDQATDPKQVILVAPAGSILTKDSTGSLSFIKESDFEIFKNSSLQKFQDILIPTNTSQELNKNLENYLADTGKLGYNRKK